jgi:hypothetical protein
MSLHVYTDVEQRSDEWFDLRCGRVTASTVGRLVTAKTLTVADNDDSRRFTSQLVAERITKTIDPTFMSDDMFRGVVEEPRAREHYSEHCAPAVECGFMLRQEAGWTLGLSPDGLVGTDGLLEIKSPRAKGHISTVIHNQVPTAYMPQLQAALLVSGRQWVDFVSWCAGEPMWPIRVYPDEHWHEAIVEAVTQFETRAQTQVDIYRARIKGLPPTERLDLEVVA